MSELELPTVVTAISSSDVEGFVAGTLYAQGWSVIFRAIDWDSLERFINDNAAMMKNALLIYAADLPGISKEGVQSLDGRVRQSIGFSSSASGSDVIDHLYEVPKAATDLISLIRGFVRTPLIRGVAVTSRQPRKAYVVAIGSAGSHTGCTMISMNLAMELSLLGKSTLLIEANFRSPSIAAYLSMRNIGATWKGIVPNLSLAEFDQESAADIESFMDLALAEFDYVVIDLGSIAGLSNRLTDRRWTSMMTTWCCDNADELMVSSRADYLGMHRLNQVIELMRQTSIRANLSFVMNMKSSGKGGDAEEARVLAAVTPIKPLRIRSLPKDSRAVSSAEAEHATLAEINERSHLRKSIASLAGELKS
jgi:Mrp family chromosome partitioning ATPase